MAPRYISPSNFKQLREANQDFPLVCAYDDKEKCEKLSLEGSVAYPDFEKRLEKVSRDERIVFYCN